MAHETIVVVGAGPAGVRAAERLAAAGVRPIVIDEAERAGGQIYRRQPEGFTRSSRKLYGYEAKRADALHAAFAALAPAIDFRPRTLVWAAYDGKLHVERDGRHGDVPFAAVILATGATDRLLPVPGWTLPGVFSLGGAQIALKAQACTVGARPVFMGTGPLLYLVACQYAEAGAVPAAVVDSAPRAARVSALPLLAARPAVLAKGLAYTARLRRLGVPIFAGATPLAIEGQDRVTGVRIRTSAGEERVLACDAVGLGFGLRSETQLADLLRCEFAFDAGARQWLPRIDRMGRATAKGVYLAGDGAGILGADAAELTGRLAACALLSDQGYDVPELEITTLERGLKAMHRFRRGLERAFPWPGHLAADLSDDTLLCRCEAITAGELRRAARELDAREINRAKAFVRAGMGRCQGRYCGAAAAEVLAAALACPLEEVGRLRGQAPVKPLPVAVETVP